MEEMRFEKELLIVKGVQWPVIEGAFKISDETGCYGMFLVDTCSSKCILNKSMLSMLDPSFIREGETMTISGYQGKKTTCQAVDIFFKLQGKRELSEVFYVDEEIDFDAMLDDIIGILGYEFLCKHNLVVDFSNGTLHTSDGIYPHMDDCSFLFSMEYGLERYGVPVVGMIGNDKEFILMADSGANVSVLTKSALEESGIEYQRGEEESCVTGFNSSFHAVAYEVNMPLLSICSGEEHTKLVNFQDTVNVDECNAWLLEGTTDADGNELLPVSGMLSASFMMRYKWVVDFMTGLIYSKKEERENDRLSLLYS